MSKISNPTKVITGVNTRWSYANVWDAKSINGGTPKYSVSLIIPKSDTVTVNKIKAAIAAAYEEGQSKLKGNGKTVPALSVLKTPLRDGDLERPDDPAYADAYFINANSATAPGIVDADRQPILERSEVYSGVYGRASINLYTLSQLIRTAFIARPGYKFIVSDYSAIEARVLAHLASETWRSKVFAEGKDIYCASASQMFGVPVEKHGINSHLRQKGKIAELALGYGGSVGALKSMGALEMGLSEEELQPLVDSWRNSNPMITAFWWNVDNAIKTAIKMLIPTEVNGIHFCYKSGMLLIKLPSGRVLSYVKPKIGENRFGGESVTYEGIGSTKKWERIESYGPKFVENIVQAVSKDLLCYAMQNLSDQQICGHVHDELIIECPEDTDVSSIFPHH